MPVDPEFLKRIHCYELPPADFDPLTAPPMQLEKLRLPARPRDDQPEALAFWKELFAAPVRFIKPEFEYIMPSATPAPPSPVEPTTAAGPAASTSATGASPAKTAMPERSGQLSNPNRFERSRNWSGSILRARRPERFTGIFAAWAVPVVAIPALSPINPAPGNPARDQYRSSIWVGLNGYRSYPHMTMPQIGTWQHVIPGAKGSTIDTAAWWQWWSRDEVTPIVKFKNVKVGTNDRILSGLILVSEDEVVFYLKNQTTGIFTWVLVQAPPQSEPLGLTAEWIVERPTTPGFTWPWRMPDFTDITFDHCHTFAGPTIVCAQQVRNLERARFIRMQERFPDPYRSSFISVPERLGTTRLAVRYQRENFSDPTVHVA